MKLLLKFKIFGASGGAAQAAEAKRSPTECTPPGDP